MELKPKNSNIALCLVPVFWPNLPPLSLTSLKAFLSKKGIKADTIDLNNYFFNMVSPQAKKQWQVSSNPEFENNIITLLDSEYKTIFDIAIKKLLEYEIIGFSCYRSNIAAVKNIAFIIRNKNPQTRIILGGPEITRQYFREGNKITEIYHDLADFLVAGEGELALSKYILGKGDDIELAAFIETDDLSCPDYSDMDFENYPRRNTSSVLFSRGCIRRCSFCAETLLYKKFKLYPVSCVIEHIKELKERGIDNFVFHDSLINGDLKGLSLLCEGIIRTFGRINWEAQIAIRSDMPDALFRKIKESGCYHLFIGLESGCDNTLKKMQKGFTARDALTFFSKLKHYGLSFGVSIITGFPGETKEDFDESLRFLIDNKDMIPKIEQVNPFVYYDGTKLPEDADYHLQTEALEKTNIFIDTIKKSGFKYTKAFMLNLVENR